MSAPGTETQETDEEKATREAAEAAAAAAEGAQGADADADALGDKGKQALDRMKAERNTAKAEAAAFKALGLDPAQIKALIDGSAEAKATAEAERAKREAESGALAKANERFIRAEIKAAAAGKLNNPADALLFLDLSSFDVDDDGEVDSAAVAAAVEKLVKDKPYLAAQSKRWEGSSDGGTRNGGPAQVTEDQLKGMTPEQIVKARQEGRLKNLL